MAEVKLRGNLRETSDAVANVRVPASAYSQTSRLPLVEAVAESEAVQAEWWDSSTEHSIKGEALQARWQNHAVKT